MKIVLVGPAYPWRGGIAHHTDQLATQLAARNEVEIVTFTRQYPSFLFPGKSQLEPDGAEPSVLTHRWIDSLNPFTWIRTGRRIRSLDPDLLLFTWSLPFFGLCYRIIAATARRRGTVRTMFLCHNITPHERRPGDGLLTRLAFASADLFLVMSAAVEEDLLRLVPGAVYARSHHPVYDRFGNPLPKNEARRSLGLSVKRIILFFGYVRAYKGLGVLIDALAQLDDVHLLVVGEFYESLERYAEQIRALGLGDRVRIINEYVPSDGVASYFSATDAVVLPYLSATQSGIIQVAYNFGTPVIASDVGGLSEMVEEGVTGRLVPPGDPDALASAIDVFFRNNESGRMKEGISAVRERYSWDSLAETIESLAARRED